MTDDAIESLGDAVDTAIRRWSREHEQELHVAEVCAVFGYLMREMAAELCSPAHHIALAEWFTSNVIEDARMRRPN